MGRQADAGRYLFAVALIAFALLHLFYAAGAALPIPGPPWVVGPRIWAFAVALVLLLGAASLVTRIKAVEVTSVLGAALVVYGLVAYLPGIFRDMHAPGGWTSGAELLCLGGVLLVFAGRAGIEAGGKGESAIGLAGRLLYAVPLLVFAVQHFIYANFVAGIVPSWIPGQIVWVYLVGVGFIAATVSLATGWQRRWAATLLGLQFLIWVVILHAPRVLASPEKGNEWTSLFVALAMGGGAWVGVEGRGSRV